MLLLCVLGCFACAACCLLSLFLPLLLLCFGTMVPIGTIDARPVSFGWFVIVVDCFSISIKLLPRKLSDSDRFLKCCHVGIFVYDGSLCAGSAAIWFLLRLA
jgi:hypothetical protein